MALKILGVGGSMREGSVTARVLRRCLDQAQKLGAETRLLDLFEVDLPMFRPDAVSVSDVMREAAETVTWADAFLLGTPDYHGSMSGAMKNFLDYHWEAFAGKLFGYLCSSHEKGLTAMDQMRTAVHQCYGWSLPYGVALHGKEDFDASGQISNPKIKQRLDMMTRDMVVYGSLLRGQFLKDLADPSVQSFSSRYRA